MALKVLEQLSSTSGKNDKLKLLKNNAHDQELAELLDATFNSSRIFHIKKFDDDPLPKDYKSGFQPHASFMSLLNRLETRQIVGNEAKAQVEEFLRSCGSDKAKWYSRVLRKDLKCGFSAKTAVKAGFNKIPLFDVMLAKDAALMKLEKLKALVAKGVWISPKLDGYRCLAIVNNGSVTLLSRNGTVYHNFPTVAESLKKSFPTGQYVFDGEIMSNDFQSMQKSAFANKRGTTVGDVRYAVFGYIEYHEWMSQVFKQTTKERLEHLDQCAQSFEDDHVYLIDQEYTEDLAYVYVKQAAFESSGFEGAMILPDIPYYLGKKSGRLLKFKTMLSQDCVVEGMYEGKHGSRLEGSMGGIIVRQENGEICECGSGFKDKDRDIMWNNQELYMGNIVEIKYQELTPDGIMRFPVFERWRNDKS